MNEEMSADLLLLLCDVSVYVSDLFENQKFDNILFHNAGHARFVEGEVIKLGHIEGVEQTQLLLIRLAAWLHDVGYLKNPANHEEAGADMASEILSGSLAGDQLTEVRRLILSTRPHFKPEDVPAMILRDADSAYASTSQFFQESENLRREWERLDLRHFSDEEWLEQNLRYLENIRWNTRAAEQLYSGGLRENIAKLKRQINPASGVL
ncbi:MAG: HD domain-containing protein [Cryomorphaceae bacterium]|nr:MAG: HD domain-containing protein [Cryomorphaceae bacterium]